MRAIGDASVLTVHFPSGVHTSHYTHFSSPRPIALVYALHFFSVVRVVNKTRQRRGLRNRETAPSVRRSLVGDTQQQHTKPCQRCVYVVACVGEVVAGTFLGGERGAGDDMDTRKYSAPSDHTFPSSYQYLRSLKCFLFFLDVIFTNS